LADPLLRDMLVIDAEGRPLPTTIRPPREEPEGAVVRERMPWFLLPGEASPGRLGTQAAGRFESGAVRLDWRVPAAADQATPELLLDLGGDSRGVRALWVEAAGQDSVWRARIEVLSSPDLQRWVSVARPVSLYRLEQGGQQLALLRVELERAPDRYLRLRHTADSPGGGMSAVEVERRDAPRVEAEPLRWLRLEGEALAEGGWVYRTPGPMRIDAWNLDAGQGNWVLGARLASRLDPDAGWQVRARADRYQWQIDGERVGSLPAALAPRRDRQWRVELDAPREAAPVLLLGYRPDRLLFLTEVEPPYRLAAGSARVRRTDAPTTAVLAAIRQQRGKDWEPQTAQLGARQPLHGDQALLPPLTPIDWRRGLLWVVLLAVAGSVVVIGLKLLRQPESG
jgi:hypothetical protein